MSDEINPPPAGGDAADSPPATAEVKPSFLLKWVRAADEFLFVNRRGLLRVVRLGSIVLLLSLYASPLVILVCEIRASEGFNVGRVKLEQFSTAVAAQPIASDLLLKFFLGISLVASAESVVRRRGGGLEMLAVLTILCVVAALMALAVGATGYVGWRQKQLIDGYNVETATAISKYLESAARELVLIFSALLGVGVAKPDGEAQT